MKIEKPRGIYSPQAQRGGGKEKYTEKRKYSFPFFALSKFFDRRQATQLSVFVA